MPARNRTALLLFLPLLLLGCGRESSETSAQSPETPVDTTVHAPVSAPPSWDASTSIGTVVAERPSTARLFELLEIDYCCGGAQTLAQAAETNQVDVHALLNVLSVMSGRSRTAHDRNWMRAPLDDVIDHIVKKHHAYLRRTLPRLSKTVATVARVHGETHPELEEVQQLYAKVTDAIGRHLEEEENEVFPAIRDPSTDAVKLDAMLARLRADHDDVGGALHRLREITNGYQPPEDACALYTQMMEGLAALERDMHAHVHLENNALFPRAEARSGS